MNLIPIIALAFIGLVSALMLGFVIYDALQKPTYHRLQKHCKHCGTIVPPFHKCTCYLQPTHGTFIKKIKTNKETQTEV